ncbi:hypothetical protein ACIRVK_32875 [Streptomyces sp. NPDC101152]|uniref:hypothetical protein n=1 Tax=Streptomyces sp. NPDC101152 TaxID=3366116 RepID=UPI0037FAB2AB
MTGAGSASAVEAHNCGSSTSPILESHPISLTVDGTTLGQLYPGYFGDCKGVHAEIHWQYGPSSPSPANNDTGAPEVDVYHVEGSVYVEGENKDALKKTSFRPDHPDGSFTTSPIMDIHTDLNGRQYAPPLKFLPDVDLIVYRTNQVGAVHAVREQPHLGQLAHLLGRRLGQRPLRWLQLTIDWAHL